MSRVAIVGFGACSALGDGQAAASAGDPGERARVAIARDEELVNAGLARPFAARVAGAFEEDRATTILARALRGCARELDAVAPRWRSQRVGLILGTSSGGMRFAERLFDGQDVRERATYAAPMLDAARVLEMPLAPSTLVLGACASSTIAMGLAARWLEDDACDLALAGGFDAVSVFVAAGFEALRATSASCPPRPFRVGRDGMALGEGAAVLALARADRAPRSALAFVAGFGASSDAVHLTAPDREGAGLARAARLAIEEAKIAPEAIGVVSAHATATPFNDPAEARAMAAALGPSAMARAVVHPFKAQIGHTLGAAGALESLACVDAMRRGVLPAAAGEGELDADARVRVLDVTAPGEVLAALKLSCAFGGANAALVLTRDPPPGAARARRQAFVSRAAHVSGAPDLEDLAARVDVPLDRIARADALVHLALDAVARLVERAGPLGDAGVVVGSALATIETNAVFHARIRERGARLAEPRRFPYTSPNAVAGELSLAFRLRGPSFAVGSGSRAGLEALATAHRLVASGDADRVVVVAVDEVGSVVGRIAPAFGAGAVAALVASTPIGARIGAIALPLVTGPFAHAAHAPLVPLAAEAPPRRLADEGAFIELELD